MLHNECYIYITSMHIQDHAFVVVFPTDLGRFQPNHSIEVPGGRFQGKGGGRFHYGRCGSILESLRNVGINIIPDIPECSGILVQFFFRHTKYLLIKDVTMYDMIFKNISCI